jgi:hemin uptake protein HemP
MGFATATLGGDAELALKVGHAAGALLDTAADVAVGDPVADADVHGAPLRNDNDYRYLAINMQVARDSFSLQELLYLVNYMINKIYTLLDQATRLVDNINENSYRLLAMSKSKQSTPLPQAQKMEPAGSVPRVASSELLGERGELVIDHQGREYRLRRTQNGKLILTA